MAVACLGGTNLFASAAFVDNVAQKGGAVYVNISTNVVCLDTTDIVRNVARESGGGLYLGGDEILLDQGLVVIEGTDVRIVGNAVGDGGKSDNVFVGEKVKFDLRTLNRPPAEFTKVAVVNGVVSLVLDEEKAKPLWRDFNLGSSATDPATVRFNRAGAVGGVLAYRFVDGDGAELLTGARTFSDRIQPQSGVSTAD